MGEAVRLTFKVGKLNRLCSVRVKALSRSIRQSKNRLFSLCHQLRQAGCEKFTLCSPVIGLRFQNICRTGSAPTGLWKSRVRCCSIRPSHLIIQWIHCPKLTLNYLLI